MTQTMAFSMGLSLYELILFSAGIIGWNGVDDAGGSCNGRRAGHKGFKNVMNLKFPLLDEKALDFALKVSAERHLTELSGRLIEYRRTRFEPKAPAALSLELPGLF